MTPKKDLLGVISNTLVDVLGNPAVEVIYDHLEHRCCLKKEEIPAKMDLFEAELEKLLGGAARIIVRKIKEEVAQEP